MFNCRFGSSSLLLLLLFVGLFVCLLVFFIFILFECGEQLAGVLVYIFTFFFATCEQLATTAKIKAKFGTRRVCSAPFSANDTQTANSRSRSNR